MHVPMRLLHVRQRGVPMKQLLRPPKGNYGVDGGSSDEKEAAALAMREHRMSYA